MLHPHKFPLKLLFGSKLNYFIYNRMIIHPIEISIFANFFRFQQDLNLYLRLTNLSGDAVISMLHYGIYLKAQRELNSCLEIAWKYMIYICYHQSLMWCLLHYGPILWDWVDLNHHMSVTKQSFYQFVMFCCLISITEMLLHYSP